MSRLSSGVASLGLLLSLCPATHGQLEPSSRVPTVEGCAGLAPNAGAKLEMLWVQVPDATSVAELGDSLLHLVVSNRTARPLRVQLVVQADDGNPRRRFSVIPETPLPAYASQTIPFPLDGLGFDLSNMCFSGMLMTSAVIRGGGSAVSTAAPSDPVGYQFSPPVYFHREALPGGGFRTFAYGETALLEEFRAGDLLGAVPLEDVETVGNLRVSNGGHGYPAFPSGRDDSVRSAESQHPDEVVITPQFAGSTAAGACDFSAPPTTPTGAYNYHICFRWEVGTEDSGFFLTAADGVFVKEDYWNGGGGGGGFNLAPQGFNQYQVVTARGPRVSVKVGTTTTWYDADPASGCLTFSSDQLGGPFIVKCSASARDSSDNVVKFVGGGVTPSAWTKVLDLEPGVPTVVPFGDFSAQSTIAAVSAFCSYRFRFGNTEKTIEISQCQSCGGNNNGNCSSAHFDFSDLDQGLAHTRVFVNGFMPCSTNDHRRWKFLVAHELGHTWLLLRTQQNEPNVVLGLVDGSSACGDGNPSYWINSIEWNSVPAREGIAHFYAVEVWNDHKDERAAFRWFNTSFDVEYYDEDDTLGGHLENTCGPNSTIGKGTVVDWMRFWWDWHTPYVPGVTPSTAQIRAIYVEAIDAGGLEKDNYFGKFVEAMQAVIDDPVWKFGFAASAIVNGIDTN